MPRPTRTCIPGYPHHVVQRGNNRNVTFYGQRDYRKYLTILANAADEHGSAIHAYVLMTNHVHLLITPNSSDGLSLTMQAVGRSYVQYINKCYERTGTLWEGRFKSSVVDSDHYCLACYRYIDLNPVRAGIVVEPLDYPWSSYRCNALAHMSDFLVPHATYVQLGTTKKARATRYRVLIRGALSESSINDIRYGIAKGLPVGSDQFKGKIEEYLGYPLGTREVGRPAKK
jgi:REP-associated tyrosine transposase